MRAMLRGTRHLLSAVLLIGVPTLLVHVGGAVPAPHRAEIRDWLHDPLADPRLLFFGLLAAGWLLWLLITLAVLQRLARRSPLRAVRQCALRLPGPLQGLTATVLGAAAITSTASGLATSAPIPPATTAAPDITADQLQLTAHVVQHTDPSPGTRPHTVTVRRGDSLWTLADRWLGDPHRWRQIYRVNAARYDRHGHMDGGNHIESGWSLTLPRAAKAPRDSPHTGSTPAPAVSAGDQQAPPATTPAGTPSHTTTPSLSVTPSRTASTTSSPATPTPVNPPRQADGSSTADSPAPGVELGEQGWVALEVAVGVTAAVALAWLHRRRRYRTGPPDAHDAGPEPVRPSPAIAALHHTAAPTSGTPTWTCETPSSARRQPSPPPPSEHDPTPQPCASATCPTPESA